ncbi:MAG: NAD-dependent epimerase/dehydratase family protein [Antricoccus sp.]
MTSEEMRADAVLIGCGDLGSRIGTLLAAEGNDVVGIRRQIDLLPRHIRGRSIDVTDAAIDIPLISTRLLIVALTADSSDAQSYRRTYVDGMRRVLDAVQHCDRAVLVSSTGVYGDSDNLVDERSEPHPDRLSAQVLLEAERAFHDAVPGGVVARLSGIYGPDRDRLVSQVRSGANPDPGRWSNRIHVDDGAAAVVHLLKMNEPEQTYIVSDTEPAVIGDIRAFIADLLGMDWTSTPTPPHGKRLSSLLLRGTGWAPQFPTYREGFSALLG